jgi:hypothetical protein
VDGISAELTFGPDAEQHTRATLMSHSAGPESRALRCSRDVEFELRPWLARLALVAVISAAACNSTPPLAHTGPSPEALATAILDALARSDRATLDGLALNEHEFRDHVWPYLPAARPERNMPFSYVWGDLRQKSRSRLSLTLRHHGGTRYELRQVTFAGSTNYGPYTVHREATLHVRDAEGQERELRVCGSMIEQDGVWKVFSYVVDD